MGNGCKSTMFEGGVKGLAFENKEAARRRPFRSGVCFSTNDFPSASA